MSEPFIGQLALVPYDFAPRGWAFCHGQLLPINQNTALFSLLGTRFGGNGQTTFALPDLRGRVPVGVGQGAGPETYALGQIGGSADVTLTAEQLPAHTHALNVHDGRSHRTSPSDSLLARGSVYTTEPATAVASASAVAGTGLGQPHENRQPFLALNWIIALQGIFPARD